MYFCDHQVYCLVDFSLFGGFYRFVIIDQVAACEMGWPALFIHPTLYYISGSVPMEERFMRFRFVAVILFLQESDRDIYNSIAECV